MGPEQRRLFNRAVFERLYVYEDRISDRAYKEPFNVLVPASDEFRDFTTSPEGLRISAGSRAGRWSPGHERRCFRLVV